MAKLTRRAAATGASRYTVSDLGQESATDRKKKENLQLAPTLLAHADTKVTQDHCITDEDVIVTTPGN